MAVNVLPLDRYLRGVVPWEAPKGWHVATYEAQAVAARSYTLATLHPGEDFDLFPDQRSQMYGGVRAERPETNLAIGATAGRVLTYRGRIITAYYFSSSGGRTSAIQDAWPGCARSRISSPSPIPYDYISPHHVWPTAVLTAASRVGRSDVSGVRDARSCSTRRGRAQSVRVLGASGWRPFPARLVIDRFKLGSNDFDAERADARRAGRAPRVRLAPAGDRVGPRPRQGAPAGAHGRRVANGRARARRARRPLRAGLRAARSVELRLAYNGVAGDRSRSTVEPRCRCGPTAPACTSGSRRGCRSAGRAAHATPVAARRAGERCLRPHARPAAIASRSAAAPAHRDRLGAGRPAR